MTTEMDEFGFSEPLQKGHYRVSRFPTIEAPAQGHERVDQRRDQHRRKDDLRQHLAKQQLADREHAVESDSDENQRVDDLAEHARDPRPKPQQAGPLARLQPAEDRDVEEGRDAVSDDPADPDARGPAHHRLERGQARRDPSAARREERARRGSAPAKRSAARSRSARADSPSTGHEARRPSSR